MTITFTDPGLTVDTPAMADKPECVLTLEFINPRRPLPPIRIKRSVCTLIPNDRLSLPAQPTIGDVIERILKRIHPKYQYLAEQDGLLVAEYKESLPWPLNMTWHIEYGPDGNATRIYP